MQVFAVFGVKPSEAVLDRIKKSFPENHLVVDDNTFLVAGGDITTNGLASTIGLGDGVDVPQMGIVVPITSYWGLHRPEVWEWIRVKGNV